MMTALDKTARLLAKFKEENSRDYQKLIELLRPEFEKREVSNAYKKAWNAKRAKRQTVSKR